MNAIDETSRATLMAQLRGHPLFDGLSPAENAAVSQAFTLHTVEAGETFIQQGGPSDALFVVLVGRCRVILDGRDKDQVGRGAVFGELGLLARAPRTASVVAIRECVVARLGVDDLDRITTTVPLFWRSLGQSAGRLAAGRPHGGESGTGATVLALLAPDGRPLGALARQMADELVRFGPCVSLVDPDSQALDRAERDNAFVVLHTGEPAWRLRQADRIVVVVDGLQSGHTVDLPAHTGTVHLWLVQPATVDHATGTARWLDACRPTSHSHLRDGCVADVTRATRLLVGRGVGVSLAGGAARGIAHLGLMRSLNERSLMVDHFTGASAGGALAAMLALGWDESDCKRGFNALLACMTPTLGRMTLPLSGLMSGRAPVDTLRGLFGDLALEDVLHPVCIPAADLETGARHLFDRGPIWRAVRATGSLPFFWPPLLHEGRLLADAGLVSNQPVDLLLPTCGKGLLVASDLGTPAVLEAPVSRDWLSGWHALVLRWKRQPFPRLGDTLIRAMTLTSAADIAQLERLSRQGRMVHLQLPVADAGFFGTAGQEDAIDNAHAFATAALARAPAMVEVGRT